MFSLVKIIFPLLFIILILGCGETPTSTNNQDKTPPVVNIAFPIDGSEVHETVTIKIIVSDASSLIESVIIFIDGVNQGEALGIEGVYEYDWETSAIDDSTTHTIIAKSSDLSGNTGQSEVITVTVNNDGFAPRPVILENPKVSGAFVTLNWSPSNDFDFSHYNIMRCENSTDKFTMIFDDSLSSHVVFTDSVVQNATYEYYIKVIDKAGLLSESNHKTVSYSEFLPPTPTNFSGKVKGSVIELKWDPIFIPDFGEYAILKKTTNLSTEDTIKIFDMSQSSYSDSVSQLNEFNYSLLAFDNFGNYSVSDEISIHSSDFQPKLSTLYPPIVIGSSIQLRWSMNTDSDFQYYKIFRSKAGLPMDMLKLIDMQNDTTYTDLVEQGYSYIYLISVSDEQGLIANSNTVLVPAESFSPHPVQLLLVEVDADTVSIEWTKNTDTDFSHYRIEQSTDGEVFVNLLEIFDQDKLSMSFGVQQYHDYGYKIVCVDSSYIDSPSNTINIQKELFLPSQIDLTSLHLSGDEISLEWNYSTDSDFQKFKILRNDVTISEIYNSEIRGFLDIVSQGLDYTYKVIVVDKALLETTSNEKSIYSDEFYPSPVEITNISYDGSVISIQWTSSEIPDFKQIDILRASDSLFSDQTIIGKIHNQNESTYHDLDILTSYARYYYKLRIIDTGDLSSESIDYSYYTFYKQIAFIREVKGIRQLFCIESDGYNSQQLTNISENVYHGLSWSPDGKNIVFDTQSAGIYIVNLESKITKFLCNGGVPTWSPEGSKIALVDNKKIYIIDASGGTPKQLIEFEAGAINWSPGGQKLALRSFGSITQIYTVDVDGGGLTKISREPTIQDDGPRWSPDGTKILYISTINDDTEIFVANSDGTNHVNLTNNIGADYDHNWSPDGDYICFRSYREGSSSQIYLMNYDGTSPINLSNNSAFELLPSFSPDSEQIVFTSDVDGIANEIYVMDRDGSNRYRLIYSDKDNWVTYPTWAP